jgi:hypothetical protein
MSCRNASTAKISLASSPFRKPPAAPAGKGFKGTPPCLIPSTATRFPAMRQPRRGSVSITAAVRNHQLCAQPVPGQSTPSSRASSSAAANTIKPCSPGRSSVSLPPAAAPLLQRGRRLTASPQRGRRPARLTAPQQKPQACSPARPAATPPAWLPGPPRGAGIVRRGVAPGTPRTRRGPQPTGTARPCARATAVLRGRIRAAVPCAVSEGESSLVPE